MSFLDQLLKSVFPEKNEEGSKLPEVLVREVIKRSSVFVRDYEKWIERKIVFGMLDFIRENHKIRSSNRNANVNYYIHRSRNANGFYFRADMNWDNQDYTFLTHYFTERLRQLDYYMNNSTREAVEEGNELKTVELFYLKPKLKYKREVPYNQLYGNVVIEHRLKNGETELVKLMVNTYTDVNFIPAKDFEELMSFLFRK